MSLPNPVQLQDRFTTLLCDSLSHDSNAALRPLTLPEFLLFKKRIAGWLTEVANTHIKEACPK